MAAPKYALPSYEQEGPFISQAYREALKDWNLLSGEFRGRVFSKTSKEDVRANELASRGRQIANYLSNLTVLGDKRAFDSLGNYMNCAGHALNAALLKHLDVENSEAYVASVNTVMGKILPGIKKSDLMNLKELNFSFDLKGIDLPGGKFADAVPLADAKGNEKIIREFAEIYAKHFKTIIIKRDDTTSGRSLRALADPENFQKLIDLVQQLLKESRFLDESEKIEWIKEAGCMILEGREINKWISEQAEKYQFTEEQLKQIQMKSADGFRNAAVEILFADVIKRMEKFLEKYPTIPLDPKELTMFFIHDFNPRIAGVKHEIGAKPVNEARNEVCPGIEPIKFARITYLGVPLKPLNPLNTPEQDLMKVLKIANGVLKDQYLTVMILQLDVVITLLESDQKISKALTVLKVPQREAVEKKKEEQKVAVSQ